MLVKIQNTGVKLGLGANTGPGVISDKRDQTDFHINMSFYVEGLIAQCTVHKITVSYMHVELCMHCVLGPVLSPMGVHTEVG